MKKIICLVSVFAFTLLCPVIQPAFGQELKLEWVRSIPSFGGESAIYSITLAEDENSMYVVGAFKDSIQANTTRDGLVTGYGGNGFALFVAKVTSSGDVEWLETITGSHAFGASSTGQARVFSISSDSLDNLYVSGAYRGTTDFDPGPGNAIESTAATNNYNSFILKLTKDGNFVWVRTIPGSNNSAPAIKVDRGEGAVYVTGDFTGKVDFDAKGAGEVLSQMGEGTQCAYVAKYDSDGNFIWVKQMGGKKGRNMGINLDIDNNNVYITGRFSDSSDYDPGPGFVPLHSYAAPDANIFILKLDKDGNYVWAKAIGSMSQSGQGAYGFSIATNSQGQVLTTGYFQTIGRFNPAGSVPLFNAHSGGTTGFISNLDASGNYAWARVFDRGGIPSGRPGTDVGRDILTDRDDAVYTVGAFKGETYMDPDQNNNNRAVFSSGKSGERDGFILKLDKNGDYEWAKHFVTEDITVNALTSYAKSYIESAKLTKSNDLYVAGYFGGAINFNPGDSSFTLECSGQLRDAFIVKFSCADTTSSVVSIDTCAKTFTYLGNHYQQSGDYKVVIPNHNGCDSTIQLQLLLHPTPDPHITVDNFKLGVDGSYNTYQWILNDVVIDGATGSTYEVKENGVYKVYVTTDKGCADTSAAYVVDNYPTNIRLTGNEAEAIRIFPNPARDLLHIIPGSFAIRDIAITDLQGRVLLQTGNKETIPVDHLASGVYFLKITHADGQIVKTFKFSIAR